MQYRIVTAPGGKFHVQSRHWSSLWVTLRAYGEDYTAHDSLRHAEETIRLMRLGNVVHKARGKFKPQIVKEFD